MPANQFPFLDWLNEMPEAAYYSLFDGGMTPAMRRYFQGQYGNTYNQYLGALGRQGLAGQIPTLSFMGWLAQNPFTQRYAALPPEWRGEGGTNLRPMTRWVL